jgi:ClpA/ClpB-like protein
MPRATTLRLTDELYARLDQASARTGMPVNSIVIAACLEWLQRHIPDTRAPALTSVAPAGPPRWATIRRAVIQAVASRSPSPSYPFERFTSTAQSLLRSAQEEAKKAGFSYIGTEHLLLAAFADHESRSAKALAYMGIQERTVRIALEHALHARPTPRNPGIIPTSRVKKVIELAFNLCGAAGDPRVSTGHILLALATEGKGIAAHILKDVGATPEHIKSAMEALTEPEA